MINTTEGKLKPRKPKSPGLIFKRFVEVEIDKIVTTSKTPWRNIARQTGVSKGNVEKFVRCMERGEYVPEYHICPVAEYQSAEDKWYLNNGETRFTAAVEHGATHFYLAEVEWVDFEGKTANYRRSIYISNDNSEFSSVIDQKKRTTADSVATIVTLIDNGEISGSDESISSSLVDLGYTRKTKGHVNLMNRIKGKLGTGGVVSTVSQKEMQSAVKRLSDEKTNVISRTHSTSLPFHRDYHPRLIAEKLIPNLKPALNDDEVKEQLVKYAFTGLTPEQILEVRPKMKAKEFIEEFYNKVAKPFVALYESGIFNSKLEVDFFNQLENDNFV